jgi:DNA-binding NarL/FixJ family response regulator
MRVLLVDDERLLLVSLTRALKVQRPDWAVETASDGIEAMRLLKSQPVDILITDVQMPGMDGLALLMQVRSDPYLAGLPLILISAQDDRSSVRRGMSSGADDYLTKPFSVEELVQTVESRLQRLEQGGNASIQTSFLRRQLKEQLTDREVEVLSLIGQGMVTKDIAAALALSPKTVSAHRQSIMEKLDRHNAAALAAFAIQAGVV